MSSLKNTLIEVAYSILPITLVVVIIQIALGMSYEDFARFAGGAVLVCIGLILFFLGTKIGIVPIGKMIGEYLPQTGKLSIIILFGLLLGFSVTVAEPDVQVLAMQFSQASQGAVPKMVLISVVGIGVAVFIALALLKLIKGWSIKHLIIASYVLVLLLALFTPDSYIPVALDSGGVTTGPMTVPFILALGVGVASTFGGKRDSFGFVGLASVGPILAVLLLGVLFG
ncbi:MAG: DUF1538 domain-containing protein [Syntrophomonadaceae bacterium]|jgi:hypothetical protein|nr:DUF1538 domain-containing protein [Bacillota bacterium]NLP23038.1 DUF1538 domain-containing protein [Syntrophomonadaceae bacterium]